MKKVFLYCLAVIILVFVSGCTKQPELGEGGTSYPVSPFEKSPADHSYLKDVIANPPYAENNEVVIIDFTVINPTKQAVTHNVKLTFDLNNCFTNPIMVNVPISANDQTPSSIKTTVTSSSRISTNKCVGTRTITLQLLDTNNQIVDHSNILVNIKE